jgi:hypothetical protein
VKPVIYFRGSLTEEDEKRAAARYFPVVEKRTDIPPGSLVIPRYSALPFNYELEQDVLALGSQLINSHRQHVYVADLRNWYEHLEPFTPKTWFKLADVDRNEWPYVLKGATNSKKNLWRTHMYAADYNQVGRVYQRLAADGLVGDQDIYVRKWEPLRVLRESVITDGPPVTEEYRFFVLDGKVIAGGFYWSQYLDDIDLEVSPDLVPLSFLDAVISRVEPHVRFFVVDVARSGIDPMKWHVIELNDGQQSGLSAIEPDDLYRALFNTL